MSDRQNTPGISKRRRSGPGGGGENSERWLTTYADLISLLMILFVVLFASSEVQKDKLMAISESVKKALKLEAVQAAAVGSNILPMDIRAAQTTAVSEAIDRAAKAFGLEKGVTFSSDERGTIITLADSYFFDAGSADLRPRVKPLLTQLAALMKEANADLLVEGHTDNIEINTPQFPSNWELSSARAINTVKFLISQGVKRNKIYAAAFADTKPLVPNTSLENRQRNRRIDIIMLNAAVETKKGQVKELTKLQLMEKARLEEAEKRRKAELELAPKPAPSAK